MKCELDIVVELAMVYVANFPYNWMDDNDILIFQEILEEDYNIEMDKDTLIILFLDLTDQILENMEI